jgi:hypothetical protein
MKNLLVLFLFLSVIALTSCTKPKDLTEDEIYSILNAIIEDDSLKFHTVCSDFINIDLQVENQNDFSKTDLEFIARQKTLFPNPTIKPDKLMWFAPNVEKLEYISIDTKCQGNVTKISFPIISADRQKALMEFVHNPDAFLGSSGGTFLYVKENGKWKLSKKTIWIS